MVVASVCGNDWQKSAYRFLVLRGLDLSGNDRSQGYGPRTMNKEELESLHFEAPPIEEVVCGLMFEPVNEMLATHLGLLWERYKPSYGTVKEVPPLATQIEAPSGAPVEPSISLSEFPLPRVWFEETNGKGLIQVQRDRFHYNWRRPQSDREYPHFEQVFKLFSEKLEIFTSFLSGIVVRELVVKQFELTYVNHVLLPNGIDSLSDMGDVFADFSWKPDKTRMRPEAMNWQLSFTLPDIGGRLHATVRSALRVPDSQPILLFDLTARGIGEVKTVDAMGKWFERAHSYIVRSFIELTSRRMQEDVWRIQK
jgi:uncharacterized protein (TIGR04255 family)